MKYAVDFRLIEARAVHVFADSPQEAVQRAIDNWPCTNSIVTRLRSAEVDSVTDLLDGDKEGDCRLVVGSCEACRRPLLNDDSYSEDSDGIKVCSVCISAPSVSG